ncbi:unnamed protein product [Gordionus sp. m RMFG-2023]|uniref:mRNA-decapping enzyme 1B-like n=1 Tax=Gordionus sp. m RMFG-2023 TaxID=3053472 RepID=UPI0030E041D1
MVEPNLINLSVIQSEDSLALSLIQTAKNVAHYKFIKNEWIETNIKGVLFIYKRTEVPYTSLFILNRLQVKNLIQPLTKDLEFELKEPYIFYKINKNEQEIYGIWFSNTKECQCIYLLLKMLTDHSRLKNNNSLEKFEDIPICIESLLNSSNVIEKENSKIVNITNKFFKENTINDNEKEELTSLNRSLFKPVPLMPILNVLNQDIEKKSNKILQKDQLKNTIIYLLQNDKKFLDQIYDTYVEVMDNNA